MFFNAIRENKILTKISVFTVYTFMYKVSVLDSEISKFSF